MCYLRQMSPEHLPVNGLWDKLQALPEPPALVVF
jgi:hypothetical protein